MDLYEGILTKIIEKGAVEMQSYYTLQKIKAVLENNSLSDFECIEKIVCIFEETVSGVKSRHDFG